MMGYGLGFGLGGWLAMIGMMIIVVAAIVLVVWLAGRAAPAAQPPAPMAPPAGQNALELLGMRFARGEITKDEYLAAKQTLEDGR